MYYIMNLLVPEKDGNRILGPLTEEQLEAKRKMYNSITSKLAEDEKREHPLTVFSLERIE